MNQITIIGNLTRDPEYRTTNDGTQVCSFSVAVNRTDRSGVQQADYFQVSAWRQLGENCAKYLAKGRKVAVTGSVRARAYIGNDGAARASMEITAANVEFLTPRGADADMQRMDREPQTDADGFTQVDDEEVPF